MAEITLESLQKQIDNLLATNDEQNKKIAVLQSAKDIKQIEGLLNTVKSHETKIGTLQKSADEAAQAFGDIQLKLAESLSAQIQEVAEEKPAIPADPVKVGKKSFKWLKASFRLPGHGRFTAAEASSDQKVLEAILALPGQKLLQELA